jgi:hypothetical protein
MPPPPPSTVLSAWEGCAPGAQRARAAAPRVQEQAGQYGLHAVAVQCRHPSGMRCADSRRSQGSGCVGLCAGPQGRRRRSPRSAVLLGTPSTWRLACSLLTAALLRWDVGRAMGGASRAPASPLICRGCVCRWVGVMRSGVGEEPPQGPSGGVQVSGENRVRCLTAGRGWAVRGRGRVG